MVWVHTALSTTLYLSRAKALNIQGLIAQGIDPIDQKAKDLAAKETN
jgi:hypothetical protein